MAGIHLIESFTCGKLMRPELNEDGYVVTPDYAAVVDGSTSKLPPGAARGPKSSGRLAMETAVDTIRRLPPQATKADVVGRLCAAIASIAPPQAEHHPEYRPTCSVALFSAAHKEVWLIGDCQCRWNGETHTHPKNVDAILTRIRCDVIRWLIAQGKATADDLLRHDCGRAAIFEALRLQTHFQNDPNRNNPFRYTVLDGLPILPDDVPSLPVGNADQLILASDGYPQLADSLAESEAILRQLLDKDPLCYTLNPATKGCYAGQASFDDRTFLRVAL
mgnify:CR=1 FL=1